MYINVLIQDIIIIKYIFTQSGTIVVTVLPIPSGLDRLLSSWMWGGLWKCNVNYPIVETSTNDRMDELKKPWKPIQGDTRIIENR